ncbi:MAG: tail-specific protease, partial [Zoogloeaceae bacterium]|nr:tail-specific protease [Zoogloeaceae bacterium]
MLRRLTYRLALFAACAFPVFASAELLRPNDAHAETAITSAHLLSRYHYRAPQLDDALSVQIFERYLKALDPARLIFLQTDVDGFSYARTQLDDAILGGRLDAPFAIFARYAERVKKQRNVIRELLAERFDFTSDENYTPDRSDAAWAVSSEALRDIWRKRIKNDWLRLRLAGKNDDAIRQTLAKRYEHALERSTKLTSDDVFQVFMNAWA